MNPNRTEIEALVRLALPSILTQVATMLMGIVDTLMVGRIGTEALAATSVGSVLVWGTLIVAFGILMGLDPIVSQGHGAGDQRRVGLALQQGLVLALVLSLPVLVIWRLAEPLLLALGQEPGVASLAARYVWVQAPSIPFLLAHSALRQYLTGRGIVAPAMWVAWLANLVNVALNWMLIFGHLGFTARGVVGAGIATGLSRVFMLLALIALVRAGRLERGGWRGWSREALSPSGVAQVLRLGLPVGAQMALEVWAFNAATLLAGVLGTAALAGHTIVINLASLSFMVPPGTSIAGATRVGNLIGARAPAQAQRAALVALGMGATVMTVSAAAFALLRWQIPRLYGAEPAVVALAAGILPVAAAFQIFDGTQAVGCGVLRGMGNTRPAAWFNLAGYWALGLPVGYWLAFDRDHGLSGLWWGLTIGLAVVALSLVAKIVWYGPERALPVTEQRL